MKETIYLMRKTIKAYRITRMLYQASVGWWIIVAFDEENKKQILELAKHLWYNNVRVVLRNGSPNWITPSLVIIDDNEHPSNLWS